MFGTEFVFGVIVGFVGATLLGVFLSVIQDEMDKVGAADRPQKTMSETAQTPFDVVTKSCAARVNLLFISLAALGGIFCCVSGFLD